MRCEQTTGEFMSPLKGLGCILWDVSPALPCWAIYLRRTGSARGDLDSKFQQPDDVEPPSLGKPDAGEVRVSRRETVEDSPRLQAWEAVIMEASPVGTAAFSPQEEPSDRRADTRSTCSFPRGRRSIPQATQTRGRRFGRARRRVRGARFPNL